MTRVPALLIIAGLVTSTAACTEAKRARNAATFGDRAADITCWTYGTETFSGRSTGKVEYGDGGRVAFVDAANGRYTTVDGECRVVYLNEGDEATPSPSPTSGSAVPSEPAASTATTSTPTA